MMRWKSTMGPPSFRGAELIQAGAGYSLACWIRLAVGPWAIQILARPISHAPAHTPARWLGALCVAWIDQWAPPVQWRKSTRP